MDKPSVHLFQDVRTLIDSRAGAGRMAGLLTIRAASVLLFRLAQAVGARVPVLGSLVKQFNHALTGADIAWQAEVGRGLVLHHPTGVVIGPYVRIGPDCIIQQGVTIGGGSARDGGRDDSPAIGARVELGPGSRILGPVSIGDDSRVAANAVVTRNVPPNSIARGVPATAHPRTGD